jgi:photosynthetic reaction center cytochrome c subunit
MNHADRSWLKRFARFAATVHRDSAVAEFWLRSGAALAVVVLAGCERPPMESVQRGFRGDGQVQIINPRTFEASVALNQAPAAAPPAPGGEPRADATFKNIKVLNDLSVPQLTRLMVAMSNWVAPEQGCAYCHQAGEDLSSDSLYTKVVARRMLQMTREINSHWQTHVATTGVTCYTCHRGNPVPANIWFANPLSQEETRFAGRRNQQNMPAPTVGYTSLPFDPFTPYLKDAGEVRVEATQALPGGQGNTIMHTEWTYALMIHFSEALGVNCTYCHNSRQFASWPLSSPARATAWYGIRMVRELNGEYLSSIDSILPPERHGPLGDGPKVNCTTCHQGAYKPLYGVSMLKDYPELAGTTGNP